MNASTVFLPALQRISAPILGLFQKFLMFAGVLFLAGVAGVLSGRLDIEGSLVRQMLSVAAAAEDIAPGDAVEAEAALSLDPRLQGALDYVSRRYKVSTEALEPVFATAQHVGRELHIDPLLIIAVIGVESGFNPFSQSGFGALGLMQVVPRFHQDKLPGEGGAFLDPVTNVRVGARVLKESIRRSGGLEEGLQQFGGAVGDAGRRYAAKVLAERQRLEQAVQRQGAA